MSHPLETPAERRKLPTIHITVDATDESIEKEIPCGCGGTLIYGRAPHTTWTSWAERVEIAEIEAYRCANCGLVAYTSAIARAMDQQIILARGKPDPRELGPL